MQLRKSSSDQRNNNSKKRKGLYRLDDNDPDIAFPIFDIKLENNEVFVCELVCTSELEKPGLITGLPFPE